MGIAAFLLTPALTFSAPTSIPGLGTVDFPVSTASPEARGHFLRGLALLHSFEYEDAAEAFRSAREADPGLAMASWGEAMTKNHPIWMEQDADAGRAALAALAPTPEGRLAKAPTEREKAYLSAVEVLYGAGDKRERDAKYAEAMRGVMERFPEDPDAAAFYALALMGTAHDGRDIPTYMKAAAILEPLFYRYPDHPGIAHYLIHACDDPIHAGLALPAARAYSKIAPDAGHAQHMCSHIFLALGDWADVVTANENAMAVVDRHRHARGLAPVGCGHYALWLEYGYLEEGRLRDAERSLGTCRAQLDRGAASAPAHAGHLDPDHSAVTSYVAMWARLQIDADRPRPDDLPASIDLAHAPAGRLLHGFTLALAAARRGDSPEAMRRRAEFDAARKDLEGALAAPGAEMDRKRVEILGLELDAAQAQASHGDSAGTLARAVVLEDQLPFAFGPPFVEKPSHELLAEMLLERGHAAEAEKEFEASLARAPRRTQSLAGLARAASAAGDAETASRAEAELREIRSHADAGT